VWFSAHECRLSKPEAPGAWPLEGTWNALGTLVMVTFQELKVHLQPGPRLVC